MLMAGHGKAGERALGGDAPLLTPCALLPGVPRPPTGKTPTWREVSAQRHQHDGGGDCSWPKPNARRLTRLCCACLASWPQGEVLQVERAGPGLVTGAHLPGSLKSAVTILCCPFASAGGYSRGIALPGAGRVNLHSWVSTTTKDKEGAPADLVQNCIVRPPHYPRLCERALRKLVSQCPRGIPARIFPDAC